jgi:hypothetical protein
LEIAQILGKADSDLLQVSMLAGNSQHARPKPRIGRDKRPLDIDGCPGLLLARILKRRRDFDRITREADIGKIIGRTFA